MPVVVEVEPAGSNCPRLSFSRGRARYPGLVGSVSKCAVAIVVQKLISIEAGDVQVLQSVIVKISDRYAHRITDPLDPGLLSNIGERSVAVIAIQSIPKAGIRFREGRDRSPVGEEDVEKTVVVVVKY